MKRNESKYKQVVNHVIDGINNGSYKKGDWILSINEFRKNYNLSRDTVFAGLSELKSKGIIDSTPGVGYYIATTRIAQKLNIFLLFNEFNEFKEDLYNSFISSIRKTANVDLYFHNYNRKVFETLINEANYKYTTYILMPGKFTNIAPLLESLSGRVFLLDHFHPELAGKYSSVAQNFEKDTYEALVYGLPHLKKYEHIIMVQKEEKEPIEVGADMIVGSLIKNPGGGLAPIGGYIAGKRECVENAAYRLTSPGLGKEVGASLGVIQSFYQGLFQAPVVTAGALKGAIFAANIYEKLGFNVVPNGKESRHDIIQAVTLNSPEALCAFCEGIQTAAPVDSYVTPEPWDMPGYDAQVIMAAGAFVQGSSIELSADGPLKPPYAVYFQGGLTWYHAKLGILWSLQKLYERNLVDKSRMC